MRRLHVLAAALLAALQGCASAPPPPDLRGIYGRAARHHDARRNPVVLIPGILGSKLRDPTSGRLVWGAFTPESADPGTPDGRRAIALPLAAGRPLDQARDGVVPAGVLDRLKVDLLGLPLELSAYVGILGTLGVGGYRDEALGLSGAVDYGQDHYTCFQFDYDWRRDCAENAARLDAFLREKKAYVEAENRRRFGASQPVQFDIVAHSMGGLLLRYYLLFGAAPLPPAGELPEPTWAGAALVSRAILVGTPSGGSVLAFTQLVQGVELSPLLPSYRPALLGTFPAVYELLPRARHGAVLGPDGRPVPDLLDPALWERMGWGLADPREDEVLVDLLPDVADPARRRALALDHQRRALEQARRFQAVLDRPATPPPGLELFLVAGDAVETPVVAAVDEGGRVRVRERGPGDGTVPRYSALLDERQGSAGDEPHLLSPIPWRQVSFVLSDHLEMTRDPAFTDQVLWLLLEDPRGAHTRH